MKSHVQPAAENQESDGNAENAEYEDGKENENGDFKGDSPEPETEDSEEDRSDDKTSLTAPAAESSVDVRRSAQLPFKINSFALRTRLS